jgi:hypothetical protein
LIRRDQGQHPTAIAASQPDRFAVQRAAAAHLVDVGRRMKRVAVEERPPQPIGLLPIVPLPQPETPMITMIISRIACRVSHIAPSRYLSVVLSQLIQILPARGTTNRSIFRAARININARRIAIAQVTCSHPREMPVASVT